LCVEGYRSNFYNQFVTSATTKAETPNRGFHQNLCSDFRNNRRTTLAYLFREARSDSLLFDLINLRTNHAAGNISPNR